MKSANYKSAQRPQSHGHGVGNQASSAGRKWYRPLLIWLAIGLCAILLGILAIDQFPTQPTPTSSKTPPVSPTQGNASPEQNPVQASAVSDPQKLSPELADIFKFIEARDTGTARIRLTKHLKLRPNDGKAKFLYGLSYHREKKYGQAVEHYAKALELNPEYYLTHHFYGWALYYLGDLEASREQFQLFLNHKPDEADSHFALGLIELDEDNLDEAERLFRRSIELSNAAGGNEFAELSRAHSRLGEVLERKGKLEEARTELVIATDLFPDHYESYYKLYRVLVQMGEQEEAARVHELYLESKERVRPGTSFAE